MLVHIYILSYFFVLWAAIFEEKSWLLIPWLIVSFVKNILTDIVSLFVGIVVCILQGPFLPVCMEFILLQCCKIVTSSYLWLSVLCLYHQLQKPRRKLSPEEEAIRWQQLKARRRKCKYNIGSNSEDTNAISIYDSEVEMCSRSLDSLITQLHYDWDWEDSLMQRRYEEVPSDTNITISLAERATRFLRLSQDEINLARRERRVKRVVKVEVGTQANTLSKKFLDSWGKKRKAKKVETPSQVCVTQTEEVTEQTVVMKIKSRRTRSVESTRKCKMCRKHQVECGIYPQRDNCL
ncbi:hypothetical protein L9F63_023076 [Diploptera punctata]|uniref:Uncharacterized protein n=1 Tax=Diploptera punctata TaxID=6984 RepID=A0AAD7ZLA6_DIPPU|nr:hypothetical protein L9F63_023076 [Diploptera punctata]